MHWLIIKRITFSDQSIIHLHTVSRPERAVREVEGVEGGFRLSAWALPRTAKRLDVSPSCVRISVLFCVSESVRRVGVT